MSWESVHRRSLTDPEGFWGEAAGLLEWEVAPSRVLDRAATPVARWFPDGWLNTCHNALDRHVAAGRGDHVALVWDSAMTGKVQRSTYRELRDEVARFAGVLASLGVGRGDRVVIYMPMVPGAVVAMLACARLGAVHSVVFGGFAPRELAARFDDAAPRVVVTASCGIEPGRVVEYLPLVDAALALADHVPAHRVVLQRPEAPAVLRPGDLDWDAAMAGAEPAGCTAVRATDPLYVLYTSGTSGRPKGVVRDSGGHAVALAWSMGAVYGTGQGEVFWAASDVGWVVGHSYIVYGPLLSGATTVLYEGKPVGTPDAGAFWRVVADHQVRTLFVAPTALRAIRREDPAGALVGRHDPASLAHLFCAGERLDPDTHRWASDVLGVPVIDHWWQTETGWPVAANCVGLGAVAVKAGSPTRPVPGYDVAVVDAQGAEVPAETPGAIVIRLPLPPGTIATLWGDDERFAAAYLARYPGCYLTGDAGWFDRDGYLYVMGRTDDDINVAGHRLSTGAMEEVLAAHPDVAECAVFGVADELKGQVPVAVVVPRSGAAADDTALAGDLVALVRDQIGPVASLKRVVVAAKLPKTRSGKILRRVMRDMAQGHWDHEIPPTIEDPDILDDLHATLAPTGTSGN